MWLGPWKRPDSAKPTEAREPPGRQIFGEEVRQRLVLEVQWTNVTSKEQRIANRSSAFRGFFEIIESVGNRHDAFWITSDELVRALEREEPPKESVARPPEASAAAIELSCDRSPAGESLARLDWALPEIGAQPFQVGKARWNRAGSVHLLEIVFDLEGLAVIARELRKRHSVDLAHASGSSMSSSV